MSSSVQLLWMINNALVKQSVSFRNGELLLSEHYLQSLLPPTIKFQGLQEIVQAEGSMSKIRVLPRWDQENHAHYLLEHTFSSTYHILHSADNITLSDSQDTMDAIADDSSVSLSSKVTTQVCDVGEEYVHVKKVHTSNRTKEFNPNIDLECSNDTSIVSWINERAKYSRLFRLLEICGPSKRVGDLPSEYNGNVSFELPLADDNKKMVGMDQKYDGHLWSRPTSTNMAIECIVHLSYCLGSLQCNRVTCPLYTSEGRYNDTFFHGHLDKKICMGYPPMSGKS